uniref:Uncharacterized protein n=1 Tax=Opuntia streptacantha TaxID=393608 RepID=A0A7C9D2A7_OPUST
MTLPVERCSSTKASSTSSGSISPSMAFFTMLRAASRMSHLPPYDIWYIMWSVFPFFVASSTLCTVSCRNFGSLPLSPSMDTFMPCLVNFSKLSSKLVWNCLKIKSVASLRI